MTKTGRYDGIKIESLAGPGDSHTRSIDTNTAQIGHSGFNRADAKAGEGIHGNLAFSRIANADADGGDGIQTVFSANILEGDGGNGGDAFAYTGTIYGDVIVTNVVTGEANDAGSTNVNDGSSGGDESVDTNIIVRSTGGTVSGDHRADARIGHNVASEAVANSNGGNAARPPQPVISFIASISSRAGGAGDASSIQEALYGDITVTAENSVIVHSEKSTLAGDEGFYAGIGHRLENDLEALGQGGISGMIGAAGTVVQATFKDDGDDDNDDATATNVADEEAYLLATYKALYEVKRRMDGSWYQSGTGDSSYQAAFNKLSAYEQSLVIPVLGDPNAAGEAIASFAGHEKASEYVDAVTAVRASSTTKTETSETGIDHRFAGSVNNEGYGSGKDVAAILSEVIFGARDNDDNTDGVDHVDVAMSNRATAVDEATYGNIPAPSADEIETLRFIMASSGDGGSVKSTQGKLGGDVSLTANAYDTTDNNGSDHTLGNARGIYIVSNDAALSATDLFAVVGHGAELIKARGGDAGLHHDTAVQTTASIGGDGGDAIISQAAASGNITLTSNYVIDIEAQNNGLGKSDEDTRVGHQLKIGSLLESFSTGTSAAVVAGLGGQDTGLGGVTRNGNGGDVTIEQGGASGFIKLISTTDIATGEGLSVATADGTVTEVAINIFADNANISGDNTEVHVGHDQHIDSAQAGDAGRMHALNTFETNKGLVGVMEGKGGDVTVTQGLLTSDDTSTLGVVEGIDITAQDIVVVKSFVNAGLSRTLCRS